MSYDDLLLIVWMFSGIFSFGYAIYGLTLSLRDRAFVRKHQINSAREVVSFMLVRTQFIRVVIASIVIAIGIMSRIHIAFSGHFIVWGLISIPILQGLITRLDLKDRKRLEKETK